MARSDQRLNFLQDSVFAFGTIHEAEGKYQKFVDDVAKV